MVGKRHDDRVVLLIRGMELKSNVARMRGFARGEKHTDW